MEILIAQTIIMPSGNYMKLLGGFFMAQNEWIHDVEKQIGYKFNNLDLLQQAFVRKTYALENGGGDNEILEFIGDRALEFVITKFLMEENGYLASETDDYDEDDDWKEYYSDLSEGELSELKKRLVQKRTLAKRTELWGWDKHLILGEGDKKNKIGESESVKEDLFEAIIGAVAVDSNWNIDAIQTVVELALDPESELEEDDSLNYVSLIQNWYSSYYGEKPNFEVKEVDNNSWNNLYFDSQNRGRFSCELMLRDIYIPRTYSTTDYISNWNAGVLMRTSTRLINYGDSKSEARRNLCMVAYEILGEQGLLHTIRDEIKNPNKDEAINQLETLSRRGYFSLPAYSFKEVYDQDGNPIWSAKCQIAEYSVEMNAKASSKKEAKKKAAFKMLKFVLKSED